MRYYQTCVSTLPKEYAESDDRQWIAYLVQNVTSLNEEVWERELLTLLLLNLLLLTLLLFMNRVSVLGF